MKNRERNEDGYERRIWANSLWNKGKSCFIKTDNGEVRVEILYIRKTCGWRRQRWQNYLKCKKAAISKHLKIFLHPANCRKKQLFPKWKQLRPNKPVPIQRSYYNLDAIIAVGYRGNSKGYDVPHLGKSSIKNLTVKGYVMDVRLREPETSLVRTILRNSWSVFVIFAPASAILSKITDIYSQCSADYDVNRSHRYKSFATVQNNETSLRCHSSYGGWDCLWTSH